MAKRRPKAYIATCQCRRIVGVIDLERTPRTEAGKLLGKWVSDGCVLAPIFEADFSVNVYPCKCERTPCA